MWRNPKLRLLRSFVKSRLKLGDAQQRICDLAVSRLTHKLSPTSTEKSSRSVFPDISDTDYTYQLTHQRNRHDRTSEVQSDSEGYTYSPPRRQKGTRLGAAVEKRRVHEHMHDSDSVDGDSFDW